MTDLDSLITGLISFSLLIGVSFQEVCHLSNMYLFMNGLKLLKGILNKIKKLFVLNLKILLLFCQPVHYADASMTWDPAINYSFIF